MRCHGYATRALALLLRYGRFIGVTRFEAHISADNPPSRRVAEKTGFRAASTFIDRDGTAMIQYLLPSNIQSERRRGSPPDPCATQAEINRAIAAAAAGEAIFGRGVARTLLGYLTRTSAAPQPAFPDLTGREREIL